MSLLTVSEVFGGYGGADILQGASLTVASDEIVVIIGPNGAGKSTLMKAVFGLVRLRQGSVSLDGTTITNLAPDRMAHHGLAYVPQERNVFVSLSVEENLEMGHFIRRGSPRAAIDRVYGLFPDLAAKRRQAAGSLSGGQRQMVAMGRALMLDPRLILLDEPTAGLSPKYMDVIFDKVREINRTGTAVLMVEQNAKQALKIAHRGYVLQTGRNRVDDTGAALLANPDVAQMFLGA
ncbi:MAG: ABC transporter ATP-binding protein [Alphaproteobacteria bacterium]|nr:ABC transporter ATP-binding protein [Alphaproteobacteria bacterium]TAD87774.1 MAG: ABC transporter ATP-binding protein [Alphaproteobacteria bacterium]